MSTLRPSTLGAVAVLVAAATAGCGVSDPYAPGEATTPATTAAAPAAQHQDAPNPIDTVTDVATAIPREVTKRDPRVRVAVDFATTQATWSPDTWIRQQRRLARLSTGAARDELAHVDLPLEDQAQALRDAKSTSRARFLAADITDGRTSDRSATVIVVLKVTAGGAGRRDDVADYTVNQAKVQRVRGAWRVSRYVTLP